ALAIELVSGRVRVACKPSDNKKCIRCWHHRPDVGSHKDHPDICARCFDNLPGHRGEDRRFF
ncbi:MAG: hypothetical protein JSS28_04705, partial [Proteobacteria bacterium]|nr:hypothetical protein [Pseudomonadota bacterium]